MVHSNLRALLGAVAYGALFWFSSFAFGYLAGRLLPGSAIAARAHWGMWLAPLPFLLLTLRYAVPPSKTGVARLAAAALISIGGPLVAGFLWLFVTTLQQQPFTIAWAGQALLAAGTIGLFSLLVATTMIVGLIVSAAGAVLFLLRSMRMS